VLDIMLPDIDGYEVCTRLRRTLRTSHVPIIFLTQKDERSDRIAGLELGADDYITKPFDIEELRLRVQGAMRRAERENLTSPTTGLSSGKMIEEQLRSLMRRKDWGLLYVGVSDFDAFTDVSGFVAGDEVLRFTALLLSEVDDKLGGPDDFIGQSAATIFRSPPGQSGGSGSGDAALQSGDGSHYSFKDRERGYIVVKEDGTEHMLR
jgi:hypothetical protein